MQLQTDFIMLPFMQMEPIIHVGILLHSTIQFELKGNFLLNSEIIPAGIYTAGLDGCGKITISTITYSKDAVYSVPTSENHIQFFPASPSSTFVLKNVIIGIGFHWEKQEDQEFEGGLKLQAEGDKIRAINTAPLEKYLKSVISSEMSAMNDPNLLNAHAIVSRSWLLAQIQNRGKCRTTTDCHASANATARNDGALNEIVKWYDREDHEIFDVCADDHCQRYQGITKVISEKAQKAIEDTRGQVLMFDNEICDARFSKCCGGFTENFENVWQPVKVPYLVAVRDYNPKPDSPDGYRGLKPVRFEDGTFITSSPEAFCNTADPNILSQILIDFDRTTINFYRWSVRYTQKELSALIAKKSGFDFGEILDLITMERGNSGRLIRLKIIGTKKELVVGKELEIRKWLSESHLFSSAFVVKKEFTEGNELPSGFILRGAGWGHGVGMCQIGAAVMSRRGYTPKQILEHYFTGASIQKIY
jgi:SpoIID/LytB domain protein